MLDVIANIAHCACRLQMYSVLLAVGFAYLFTLILEDLRTAVVV